MSTFETMFEINTVTSRIIGQASVLHIGITAGVDNGFVILDDFEIRDSKGIGITNKMANTMIHNLACALEDSKHCGTYFKVSRDVNDFKVVCDGNRGLNICLSCIKKEVDKMFDTIKKCKADIKKMADQFGVETIQHVLTHKRMELIR